MHKNEAGGLVKLRFLVRQHTRDAEVLKIFASAVAGWWCVLRLLVAGAGCVLRLLVAGCAPALIGVLGVESTLLDLEALYMGDYLVTTFNDIKCIIIPFFMMYQLPLAKSKDFSCPLSSPGG